MGYKITELEPTVAYESIWNYKYALVYMISELKLCQTAYIGEIDWEECLEARFFSEDKELHIFDGEDGKKAVEVKDDGKENIIEKKIQLDNKFRNIGKFISVQEYLAYDKDGQVSVEITRLKGVE